MERQGTLQRYQPLVRRSRLTATLEAITRRKVALITAPGGYGKSTLIQELVQQLPSIPFCWVHLDPADASLPVFLEQLVRAVQAHLPSGELFQVVPQRPPSDLGAVRHLGRRFAEGLTDHVADRLVIVLDDLHQVAESQQVMSFLEALLQHLPPTVHVIIAARGRPALPLARLEAQGEVIRLTEQDLSFTPDEVERFFAQRLGVTPGDEVRKALVDLTEGWVTALVLLANLMQEMAPSEWLPFLRQFPGGGALFNYLAEEVFERQPEELQKFMMATCVLTELRLDVIEQMLGINCAGRALQRLEASNCFIVAVMGEKVSYRYHHLFHAFLYHRLVTRESPEKVRSLHERAAGAYERFGYLAEATEHYLRGGRFDRAASLMAQQAEDALKAMRHEVVQRWLKQLPTEMLDNDPDVLFVRTQLVTWWAQYDVLPLLYQRCLEQYEARGDYEGLTRALSWGTNRYWKLRHPYFYESPARWAAHAHPEVRTYGRMLQAFALTARGRWGEAFARLEALLGEVAPASRAYFDCLELLAVLAFWRGDFRKALKYGISHTAGKTALGDFAWGIYTWISFAFLGDPLGMERYHRQYMAQEVPRSAELLHDLVGTLGKGIMHLYHHRWEEALEALESLEPYFTTNHRAFRTIGSEATFTAQLELAGLYERLGDLEKARRYLERNLDLASGYPELAALAHMALARFLAERGDRVGARTHLARAREADPPGLQGLTTMMVELAACRVALAEGDRKAAAEAMARVLPMVRERECPALLLQHGGPHALPLLAEMAWGQTPGGLPGQVVFEVLELLGDQLPAQLSPYLGHSDPAVRGAAFRLIDQLRKAPAQQRATVLKVYTMGSFRLYRYDRPVDGADWKRTKVRLLFLMLLLRKGKRLSKQAAMEALWPDAEPAAARNNLRATIHGLRRSLEPDLAAGEDSRYVRSDRESVWLDHLDEIWMDLWEFEQLLARSRELERAGRPEEAIGLLQAACDLNRGMLLPDAALEEYFHEERVRVEQAYLKACLKVARYRLEGGQLREAVDFARRALKVDRALEEAYQVLIQAYLARGDRPRAMQAFRMCRKNLRLLVGAEPSPEIRNLLGV